MITPTDEVNAITSHPKFYHLVALVRKDGQARVLWTPDRVVILSESSDKLDVEVMVAENVRFVTVV